MVEKVSMQLGRRQRGSEGNYTVQEETERFRRGELGLTGSYSRT
jgi:hypothetical protein